MSLLKPAASLAGRFFMLVEIRTKLASLLPFLLGSAYALFRFQSFDPLNFALMFVSLLSFDMATTTLNNYMDYKKAHITKGYGYEEHNPVSGSQVSEKAALAILLTLLALAGIAGFVLFLRTDLLVLALGGLSFLIGLLYSYGPIPISRMPLGELFSGLFMGFVIIFIAAYIHTDAGQLALLHFDFQSGRVLLEVQLYEVLRVLLYALPAVLGIANIMLANNICDMEEDARNRRYTLPVYIGRTNALRLFRILYLGAYAEIFVLFGLGVHLLLAVLLLLTCYPVFKNAAAFNEAPTKRLTFGLAVKNFLLICAAQLVIVIAELLI